MTKKPVQVQARWKHEGIFEPTQFLWQGKMYRVDSIGRAWEDPEGYHVLCMIHGGNVFELIFHLNPAGWTIRQISRSSSVA